MINEQIQGILIAKVEQELNDYKENLIKNFTAKEIIEKSYETTFKEEVVSMINGLKLEQNEIKALLKTDKVLDKMYNKYLNIETSMLDNMRDITRDIIIDINKEFIKKMENVR